MYTNSRVLKKYTSDLYAELWIMTLLWPLGLMTQTLAVARKASARLIDIRGDTALKYNTGIILREGRFGVSGLNEGARTGRIRSRMIRFESHKAACSV